MTDESVKRRLRSVERVKETESSRHLADSLLTEFFCRNNIPNLVGNCPTLRQFLKVASNLPSIYVPPGRETLSKVLVPELADSSR